MRFDFEKVSTKLVNADWKTGKLTNNLLTRQSIIKQTVSIE